MTIELVKALQDPTLYKHTTEGFSVLETHISWVILTGPYAYKIKKPVNFGFLDFSSLDKRKYYCEEELRLNRRLAPDLYLEVIPIWGTETSPVLGSVSFSKSADSEEHKDREKHPIEYALKMVQFPQSGLLEALQKKRALTSKHIHSLAKILANFHQSVDTTPPDDNYGTATAIFAPVLENFEQIQAKLYKPEQLDTLSRLKEWADSSYQRLQPLITKRKALGFIRECHGDLHLGNITLLDQELVIFDCIEFNASLSWIDVISDLSFLIMDLEKRGQSIYANQLTNDYLEITGDYEGVALLNFYKAYRAMVRAKVAVLSLQASVNETTMQKNLELMRDYQAYTTLAERYQAIPNRYILLMHGYSGSGKSVVGRQLSEQLGAIRIRTDVERKRLFHYDAHDRTDSPIGGGIYTNEATRKTYERVAEITSTLLDSGESVLVDATSLKQWQRQRFLQVAESHAVPLLLISCRADHEVLLERVIKRASQNNNEEERDASEAKVDTLNKQLLTAEPLSDNELRYTIPIDTDQTDQLQPVIDNIKRHLEITALNY